jgi:hypothetical protein
MTGHKGAPENEIDRHGAVIARVYGFRNIIAQQKNRSRGDEKTVAQLARAFRAEGSVNKRSHETVGGDAQADRPHSDDSLEHRAAFPRIRRGHHIAELGRRPSYKVSGTEGILEAIGATEDENDRTWLQARQHRTPLDDHGVKY